MPNFHKLFIILIVVIIIGLFSCHSGHKHSADEWSTLPKVTPLSQLKQTDFSPTLENTISVEKNTIYAPSLLLAMSKLRQSLRTDFIAKISNSTDLKLLLSSNSYRNALTEDEYTDTIQVVDGKIKVRAFFRKELPFETKLDVAESPILFSGVKVAAFCLKGSNPDVYRTASILYYMNDSNFILELTPHDTSQEIILAKCPEHYTTLGDGVETVNRYIEKGVQEKKDPKLRWKYYIGEDDYLSVPMISYNLETNYTKLEGQTLFTKENDSLLLMEVYQRIGFKLNEHGAIIETEAEATAAAAAVDEKISPKYMLFDKPFLVILRRTCAKSPYFVMMVNNSELLVKK